MTNDRKCYGTMEEEVLHASLEDAIDILKENGALKSGRCPIIVYEFAPREINPKNYVDSVLEYLLEDLDDEFAEPDGRYTEPNEVMKEAAMNFVKTVVNEYYVWSCIPSGKVFWVNEDGTYKEQ